MSSDNDSDDEYYVNLRGNYCKRKIERWYINMHSNQIHGYVRSWPCNCIRKINNVILSYIDTYVVVRIGPHNYALILGEINPDYSDQWQQYMHYLKTKAPKPFIQI